MAIVDMVTRVLALGARVLSYGAKGLSRQTSALVPLCKALTVAVSAMPMGRFPRPVSEGERMVLVIMAGQLRQVEELLHDGGHAVDGATAEGALAELIRVTKARVEALLEMDEPTGPHWSGPTVPRLGGPTNLRDGMTPCSEGECQGTLEGCVEGLDGEGRS